MYEVEGDGMMSANSFQPGFLRWLMDVAQTLFFGNEEDAPMTRKVSGKVIRTQQLCDAVVAEVREADGKISSLIFSSFACAVGMGSFEDENLGDFFRSLEVGDVVNVQMEVIPHEGRHVVTRLFLSEKLFNGVHWRAA